MIAESSYSGIFSSRTAWASMEVAAAEVPDCLNSSNSSTPTKELQSGVDSWIAVAETLPKQRNAP